LPINSKEEIMKKIFFALLTIGALGCGACNPAELETEEIEDTEPYPFATWESCASTIGDHPCNFTLVNQEGSEVNLYDFYGSPVVIDFSAMWCGPCQIAAVDIEDTVNEFPEINYITILIENKSGQDPTTEDLDWWAQTHGISEPVLAGNRDLLQPTDPFGWPISAWPTFFYIDDEMVLQHSHRGYSKQTVDQNIEILLAD